MSFGTSVPNVGGARRDWSNVIVDGVVANEVGTSGLMAQQINLDAIAEVRVLLNSYRAEYGRAGRRAGADRQQERHVRAITATSITTAATRRSTPQLLQQPVEHQEAALPLQHLRRQPRRPGARQQGDKKLFFFYSLEAPLVSRPERVRNWTMPTALEMQGDFSQTLDAQGRLINIKDPRATGRVQRRDRRARAASRATSSRPNRINPNGMALLNMLPLAEQLDRTFTQGSSTTDAGERRQPEDEQRRPGRLAADVNDSLSFTFKDW